MAEAAFQQALTLHRQGRLDEAGHLYARALQWQPRHFESLRLSGAIALQKEDFPQAVQFLAKAIQANARSAEAHYYLGYAQSRLDQPQAALASYEEAISLKPDFAFVHYDRANLLREMREPEAAVAGYLKAIALKPDYADAFNNCGLALLELEQYSAALAHYDQAVSMRPDFAEAHFNRGNVFLEMKELEAALAGYDHAISLKPDYVEAHLNRGTALNQLGRLDAALASFDQAIALRADAAELHVNRACTLLLSGNFESGWIEYEWRKKTRDRPPVFRDRHFVQPLWLGDEPIAGRTILLYGEQGFGDTLQFCRYAELVATAGARVLLEVEKPLASLLANLKGVSQLLIAGSPLPDFDYHCPLLSLPLAFKTKLGSIPAPDRYLGGDPTKIAKWQARLGQKKSPRIGLTWSGSPLHKNDRNRSIELAALIAHLPDGFQYVSLQKDVREQDRAALAASSSIFSCADDLTDFSETAALCECLDVVVSVDTSTAHLSGAIGARTWILLPRSPDWRWLMDREDTPWYLSARLYRQETPGDWNPVLRRVAKALKQIAG
jgi:tetratricopeptide (TPR) repeat protein